MGAPVRRTQPGDTATLLIHHELGVAGQHAAQRVDQAGKLVRVLDVAREQDDAGRGVSAKQRRFLGQQNGSGDADDGGLGSQIRTP